MILVSQGWGLEYKCQFCSKVYIAEGPCKEHEDWCPDRPTKKEEDAFLAGFRAAKEGKLQENALKDFKTRVL